MFLNHCSLSFDSYGSVWPCPLQINRLKEIYTGHRRWVHSFYLGNLPQKEKSCCWRDHLNDETKRSTVWLKNPSTSKWSWHWVPKLNSRRILPRKGDHWKLLSCSNSSAKWSRWKKKQDADRSWSHHGRSRWTTILILRQSCQHCLLHSKPVHASSTPEQTPYDRVKGDYYWLSWSTDD